MAKGDKYREPPQKRTRSISRGEAQLWKKVTTDVKAFDGRTVSLDDIDPMPEPVATFPHPNKAPDFTMHRPQPSAKALHSLTHGEAAGVDKRTMERLRRGKLPLEGRLDLHGYNQEQAYRRLSRFIETSYANGKRAIAVITGKGTQLTGEIGVLRQQVPQWLNQPHLRARIIAFNYAPKGQGGGGALYILLKRWR